MLLTLARLFYLYSILIHLIGATLIAFISYFLKGKEILLSILLGFLFFSICWLFEKILFNYKPLKAVKFVSSFFLFPFFLLFIPDIDYSIAFLIILQGLGLFVLSHPLFSSTKWQHYNFFVAIIFLSIFCLNPQLSNFLNFLLYTLFFVVQIKLSKGISNHFLFIAGCLFVLALLSLYSFLVHNEIFFWHFLTSKKNILISTYRSWAWFVSCFIMLFIWLKNRKILKSHYGVGNTQKFLNFIFFSVIAYEVTMLTGWFNLLNGHLENLYISILPTSIMGAIIFSVKNTFGSYFIFDVLFFSIIGVFLWDAIFVM